MFIDQFVGMNGCFIDQSFCLGLGIVQNCLFVADDLLITFDLIRCLHAQFPQQFIDFILINNDLGTGHELRLTALDIIFYFVN